MAPFFNCLNRGRRGLTGSIPDRIKTMLKIGDMNELPIVEITDKGCFLDAESDRLFIPRSQMAENAQVGDQIAVFLYYDDGRLTATARRPRALMGEIACLRVVGSSKHGYFLDNAVRKDVFLPQSEAGGELERDQEVIVYLYLDHEKRMCATTRFTRRFSDLVTGDFKVNDVVKVMPVAVTDIGVKAVVENSFYAMFLKNEVPGISDIRLGKKIYAVIRRIRDDRRVDIIPSGNAGESSKPRGDGVRGGGEKEMRENRSFAGNCDLADAIVARLEQNGGFLPFSDKSSPEDIQKVFHVSKGKFKQTIGNLYRSRIIEIAADGIRLTGGR